MTVILVRHGETEWSLSGQHTSRTDVPLTNAGREAARRLGARLAGREFALVLTSPRSRARDTCAEAGLGDVARVDDDLVEWDYGSYEGLTTPEIRVDHPGWLLWEDGVPGGETARQVAARADRVIERAIAADGDVALFAHGHVLRVLGARWLGLPPERGGSLALETASLSELGFEHENRVIWRWNDAERPSG
jgi:broad specificity phosphatase PhoE